MDWWQLLYAFIGSFLGFGFALFTEAIINAISGKNERIRRKACLLDELDSIVKLFKGNEDKDVPLYIEVPVWQSICSTGTLFPFLKEDGELYNNIMVIYNHIFALRSMEKEMDKNFHIIIELRRQVVSEIEELKNL